MEMSAPTDDKLCETWDRLVLLLISQPREGWEPEFKQISRREIERLTVPSGQQEHDE